jgi:hypothetical protein
MIELRTNAGVNFTVLRRRFQIVSRIYYKYYNFNLFVLSLLFYNMLVLTIL